MRENYVPQVRQLLTVLPHVMTERKFALKGGTAINLFVRECPRLSVDIDLTYTPILPRGQSLDAIAAGLDRISDRLLRLVPGCQLRSRQSGGRATALLIELQGHVIKVEPNLILRGTILPTQSRTLSNTARSVLAYEGYLEVDTLSFEELYAGKMCAALDRQHPRDLFDIRVLLDTEGITAGVRKAFVVYLAGHNRPISELLEPSRKDIESAFRTQFAGMTSAIITSAQLADARDRLIRATKTELSTDERAFLVSMKKGEPLWNLLGVEGLERLPALQWKLANIRKMDKKKRAQALDRLKKVLEL